MALDLAGLPRPPESQKPSWAEEVEDERRRFDKDSDVNGRRGGGGGWDATRHDELLRGSSRVR